MNVIVLFALLIAIANAQSWYPIAGVSGTLSDLKVNGTSIYVGGNFNSSTLQAFARYDTVSQTWSSLGISQLNRSVSQSVSSLAILGDDLFIGGSITTTFGVFNAVRYNVQTDSLYSLGPGGPAGTPLLTAFQGSIYGAATSSNLYILRVWTNGVWANLTNIAFFNSAITKMVVINSKLYIAANSANCA